MDEDAERLRQASLAVRDYGISYGLKEAVKALQAAGMHSAVDVVLRAVRVPT